MIFHVISQFSEAVFRAVWGEQSDLDNAYFFLSQHSLDSAQKIHFQGPDY